MSIVEARGAVAVAGERLLTLLRSGLDPDRSAVGHWTVGDVAAHLSHVSAFDAISASGVTSTDELELPDFVHDRSVLAAIEEVRDFEAVNRINKSVLAQDPERRPEVLADPIERSLGDLDRILATRDDAFTVSWLGGTRLPLVAITGHFLFEAHCHGFDIARASGRRWAIEPSDVRVILDGFFGPFIEVAPEVITDGGGSGCVELRLRGQTRSYLLFDGKGPHIEKTCDRPVDLHLSADPATFLLVMSGRRGRLGAALTGRVIAWGRRPLLGMKLLSRLRSP